MENQTETSIVRVQYGGEQKFVVLYSGLPSTELSSLVRSMFSIQDDSSVVGFSDSATGVTVPVSVACRFPQQLQARVYNVLLTDSSSTKANIAPLVAPPVSGLNPISASDFVASMFLQVPLGTDEKRTLLSMSENEKCVPLLRSVWTAFQRTGDANIIRDLVRSRAMEPDNSERSVPTCPRPMSASVANNCATSSRPATASRPVTAQPYNRRGRGGTAPKPNVAAADSAYSWETQDGRPGTALPGTREEARARALGGPGWAVREEHGLGEVEQEQGEREDENGDEDDESAGGEEDESTEEGDDDDDKSEIAWVRAVQNRLFIFTNTLREEGLLDEDGENILNYITASADPLALLPFKLAEQTQDVALLQAALLTLSDLPWPTNKEGFVALQQQQRRRQSVLWEGVQRLVESGAVSQAQATFLLRGVVVGNRGVDAAFALYEDTEDAEKFLERLLRVAGRAPEPDSGERGEGDGSESEGEEGDEEEEEGEDEAAARFMGRPSAPTPNSNELVRLVDEMQQDGEVDGAAMGLLKQLMAEENEYLLAALEVYENDDDEDEVRDTLLRVLKLEGEKRQIPVLPNTRPTGAAEGTGASDSKSESEARYSPLLKVLSILSEAGVLDEAATSKLVNLVARKNPMLLAAFEAFSVNDDMEDLVDTLARIAKHAQVGEGEGEGDSTGGGEKAGPPTFASILAILVQQKLIGMDDARRVGAMFADGHEVLKSAWEVFLVGGGDAGDLADTILRVVALQVKTGLVSASLHHLYVYRYRYLLASPQQERLQQLQKLKQQREAHQQQQATIEEERARLVALQKEYEELTKDKETLLRLHAEQQRRGQGGGEAEEEEEEDEQEEGEEDGEGEGAFGSSEEAQALAQQVLMRS